MKNPEERIVADVYAGLAQRRREDGATQRTEELLHLVQWVRFHVRLCELNPARAENADCVALMENDAEKLALAMWCKSQDVGHLHEYEKDLVGLTRRNLDAIGKYLKNKSFAPLQ